MARTTFYAFQNQQVTTQPNIGLDASTRQAVVVLLNLLLADEVVLGQKIRRASAQIGEKVSPGLQAAFDTQHTQITAFSSEITERILILGGAQPAGPTDLIHQARLDEGPKKVPNLLSVLADHEAFLRFLREDARKCSELYDDQGTFALLVDVMRSHEKSAWVLQTMFAAGEPI